MNSPRSSNLGDRLYSSRSLKINGSNSTANAQRFAEDFALEHSFARPTSNQGSGESGAMIPAAVHESAGSNQYSPSCAYQG